MPDLNEKFRNPIQLALMTDEEEMTESSVKNAYYTNAKGKMNVALSNWKLSGNGKGNINTKVRGLGYDIELSDENSFTYVDDDRCNCFKQLHIAYFWSLSEVSG